MASLALILTTLVAGIVAQHTQDPGRCVADSGITAFNGCHAWDSLVTACARFTSTRDATGYFSCYCQQAYLNALYDCNNEERLCLPQFASQIDQDFTDDYYSWHSWCDPIVNYTPTSPGLSSITASYDPDSCHKASSACLDMDRSRNKCYATWNSADGTTVYSSCVCAPPVLSLEYTCSVLGNVSCLQVPAHLDRMTGWSYCKNIDQVLTLPPSLTATLGSGTTLRATLYTPSTSTAAPGGTDSQSSATQTASGPSSTQSSGAARRLPSMAGDNAGVLGREYLLVTIVGTLVGALM